MSVHRRRTGCRARTRAAANPREKSDGMSRRPASPARGIVPQTLNAVAVLSVGTVRLAETLVTTALRGVVNVAVEAVDGVRTIGSDVLNGTSSSRDAGVRSRSPRDMREREAA